MERTTVAGASNYPTVSARFIIPPSGRPEATRIVSKHLASFFIICSLGGGKPRLPLFSWLELQETSPLAKCRLWPLAHVTFSFFLSFRISPNCKRSPLCVRQGSLQSASLSRQCYKDLGQWHWNSSGSRFAPSTEGKHTWTQTSIRFPPLFS